MAETGVSAAGRYFKLLVAAGVVELEAKRLIARIGVETLKLLEKTFTQKASAENADRMSVAQDLVDAWNEHLPPVGLQAVKFLSTSRRMKVMARLREHPEPEFWGRVFHNILNSAFLLGKKNGNGPHQHWRCDFDFLIANDTTCIKIYEGRYNETEQPRFFLKPGQRVWRHNGQEQSER